MKLATMNLRAQMDEGASQWQCFGILNLLYAVEGQRLWIVSRAVGKITENDNFCGVPGELPHSGTLDCIDCRECAP